jgi:hypothetical protein
MLLYTEDNETISLSWQSQMVVTSDSRQCQTMSITVFTPEARHYARLTLFPDYDGGINI